MNLNLRDTFNYKHKEFLVAEIRSDMTPVEVYEYINTYTNFPMKMLIRINS